MYPHLVQLGPLTISTYGVVVAMAFLVAVGLARHVERHAPLGLFPINEAALVDWAVWAVVGGLLGGRLLYVLLNWPVYAQTPLEIMALWHGGLIWYGGFLGGLLGTWLSLRRRGIGFLRGVDQVIPFMALGHAVGRIGCFANGCCYGIPTSAWFGVQFPGLAQPVIPTQLLESAALAGLYLALRRGQTPSMLRRPGALFGWYLLGYALIRGVIECWRANQPMVWGGITLHQAISIGLAAVGLRLVLGIRHHGAHLSLGHRP